MCDGSRRRAARPDCRGRAARRPRAPGGNNRLRPGARIRQTSPCVTSLRNRARCIQLISESIRAISWERVAVSLERNAISRFIPLISSFIQLISRFIGAISRSVQAISRSIRARSRARNAISTERNALSRFVQLISQSIQAVSHCIQARRRRAEVRHAATNAPTHPIHPQPPTSYQPRMNPVEVSETPGEPARNPELGTQNQVLTTDEPG